MRCALTPSRAIDLIALQFSRKMRAASLALSRLDRQAARASRAVAGELEVKDISRRFRALCAQRYLLHVGFPQSCFCCAIRAQDSTGMRHLRDSARAICSTARFYPTVLPGFNRHWNQRGASTATHPRSQRGLNCCGVALCVVIRMHHQGFLDRGREHRSSRSWTRAIDSSAAAIGAGTLGFHMHPCVRRKRVVKPDAVVEARQIEWCA